MRKTFPILALLTLAAAASAQTITLSPVATSGYSLVGTDNYSLAAGTRTFAYRKTFVNPPPYGSGISVTSYQIGWRAEFALPTAPSGTRLASAFFETRVLTAKGSGSHSVELRTYAGSGAISALRPAPATLVTSRRIGPIASLRIDVAAGLGTGPYAGVDLVCPPFSADGVTPSFSWSAPTLTLTYAPVPVPEPASFAALGLGAVALIRRRKAARS